MFLNQFQKGFYKLRQFQESEQFYFFIVKVTQKGQHFTNKKSPELWT